MALKKSNIFFVVFRIYCAKFGFIKEYMILLTIGRNIKNVREKQRNLTQKYVAGKLGISCRALSSIENGRCDISIKRLEEIARVLEISMLTLIVAHEEPTAGHAANEGNLLIEQKEIDRLIGVSLSLQSEIIRLLMALGEAK